MLRLFPRTIWYERGNYLYDVVDCEEGGGNDHSLRPNQILAISLDFPVLSKEKWLPVMECVKKHLLMPFGLRFLAPVEKEYRPRYYGNLRARDAAYHQGTVWPWLIGAYIDAWLKVHPDKVDEARSLLSAFKETRENTAVGSIAEITDADAPYTARGLRRASVERCRSLAKPSKVSNYERFRRVSEAPARPIFKVGESEHRSLQRRFIARYISAGSLRYRRSGPGQSQFCRLSSPGKTKTLVRAPARSGWSGKFSIPFTIGIRGQQSFHQSGIVAARGLRIQE